MLKVTSGNTRMNAIPANIGEFTVPLGVPEILCKGKDATVVTYGACCQIAMEAAERLAQVGIEIEVIDVQTLLYVLPADLCGSFLQESRYQTIERIDAYGSDGDYWSKPNRETIFETVYEMMHEGNPRRFPIFYK